MSKVPVIKQRYYGSIAHQRLYISDLSENGAKTIVGLLEELNVPVEERPIYGEVILTKVDDEGTTAWRIEEPEGNQHESVRRLEHFRIRSSSVVTGLREQDLFYFLQELRIHCSLTRRNDQPLFAPYTTLPPHLRKL